MPLALVGLVSCLVLWELFRFCDDRWAFHRLSAIREVLIRIAQCGEFSIINLFICMIVCENFAIYKVSIKLSVEFAYVTEILVKVSSFKTQLQSDRYAEACYALTQPLYGDVFLEFLIISSHRLLNFLLNFMTYIGCIRRMIFIVMVGFEANFLLEGTKDAKLVLSNTSFLR